MRIAHIITRMIIGGAQENTLLNCLDLMHDHGDEVLLITGPSVGPEGNLLDQGRAGELPIEQVPSLRRAIHPYHDWQATRSIRSILRTFRPDVVHTHSAKGGLLGRHVAWGLRDNEGQRPAVIHTVHGAPFHPFQSAPAREFFRRCERWAAQRCHHMVSVADAMTDLMVDADVAPREKFTTIYSGMDVDPFLHSDDHRQAIRDRFGFRNEHVVIGKIARLFHLKGHDDLITAAAIVASEYPQVRFLLVGDGLLRQPLTDRIASLGLQDHFVFAGLVPPSEVPPLIGAMDVLVHTSLREGLARALPQALLAGKPAVSYDVDGAREVVINDQTGYLIEPGDTQGLAKSLSKLTGNQKLRAELGGAGQRRFTEQFRHETMTRLIRELYLRTLGSLSR
ncbi:glycosyltransferase family 4 protein [Stieleria varia]|uniref:Putative glycosyltransferase EpsD n=1 Tax=Stieleria varia TaxID=2528005 RepID=A0A5C6AMP2_9BACT|nr:glycosyltransferase family 4 protein [Stieleria varia]TWU00747.1 putative glycosyltransferase EpsD [Stieleria varia]